MANTSPTSETYTEPNPLQISAQVPVRNPVQSAVDLHLIELSAIRQGWTEDEGDVLAVITFPKNDTRKPRACDGQTWEKDLYIRMRFDKLMCLGSSKIRSMFKPRAQERFRRHLNLDQLPAGITSVLDFTPPTEGSELADLTAMLWLPKTVKLWFLAGHYIPKEVLAAGNGIHTRPMADKAVGCVLTLGHDDVCQSKNCLGDLCQWGTKDHVPGIFNEDPLIYETHIEAFRKVDDYCPIRHRVAIMRVLRAINGHGLLLNSAVRMWTVAQVAISLEVPEVVVDPITQWLTAPPNTKFVEICPEKAFQLAYALKIPNVLTAAFKILVNENAIDLAATDPSPRMPSKTWIQRRRDEYGDFPSDPVDYASRAFLERMAAKLDVFRSDHVFDLLPTSNPEWNKLRRVGVLIEALQESHPLRSAYRKITQALVYTFRQAINGALEFGATPQLVDLLEAQRHHYLSSREIIPIHILYSGLNDVQKILTPFFWKSLRLLDLNNVCGDMSFETTSLRNHITTYNDELTRAVVQAELPDPRNVFSELESQFRFNAQRFFNTLSGTLRTISSKVLNRDDDDKFPFFLSDHLLLTLEDSELKYLPIWADGLDDESGGVFQEVIPPAEMGPSEPGPAYHTGYTVASSTARSADTDMGSAYASTIAPSDLGLSGLGIDDATVARSLSAQQSVSSAVTDGPGPNTRRVVAMPTPSDAALSEQFTMEDDNEFAEATFKLPAQHQAQGQALAAYVEDIPSSSASSATGSSVVGGNWTGIQGTDDDDDVMQFSYDEDDDNNNNNNNGNDDDDDGTSTLDGYEELDPWSVDI